MKNHKLTLAVLAMAALVSCQENEFRNDVYTPEEGEILFRIANNAKTTKSSDAVVSTKSEPIFLGTIGNQNLYLEETITRMDDITAAPVTKGTPGYTQNFHQLYGGFNAAAYQVGSSTAYEADGRFEPVDTEKLIYKRKYGNDLWDASKGIYFFLHAGEGDGGLTGITSLPAGYNATNGTITFDYDASELASEGKILASATKDILFTSRKVKTQDEYNLLISKDQGIPVLFHHIFSGVKFAIGNPASDDATISINSVTFTGLYDKGHCVVTPREEEETGYKDNPDGDYSSAETSIWSSQGYSASKPTYYSGAYSTPVTYGTGDGEVKDFGDKGTYPSSFSAAGNERNLNDSKATQTFWFIPQSMARTNDADHVVLTVNVTEGSETYDFDIDLTKVLVNAENEPVYWHAGEIRTYTLTVDYVNVRIDDTVNIQNADSEATPYIGSTKQNVIITNTGATDTYIRAAIIGQWLNVEGDPVFGFTDFTKPVEEGQFVMVDSWYQDQFGTGTNHGQHKHGAFKNLVGYKNDTDAGTPGTEVFTSDWWLKGSDGYYYFKYVVPAGKAIPAQDTNTKYIKVSASGNTELATGAPLFESYTVKDAPDARVAGHVEEIFFELEIATQAVSAKKTDGTYYTLTDAWARAGITVTE